MRQLMFPLVLLIFLVSSSLSGSNLSHNANPFVSYAQSTSETYVDFEIKNNLVTYDGVFGIEFDEDLSGEYLVRPMLNNGNIEIYNPTTSSWSGSSLTWDVMPKMEGEMFLKISSLGSKKNNLSFELLDISKGQVLKTTEKPIFGKKVYEHYISSVNNTILHEDNELSFSENELSGYSPPLQLSKDGIEDTPQMTNHPATGFRTDPSLVYLYIGLVTAVLCALVVSYFSIKRLNKIVLK